MEEKNDFKMGKFILY